MCKCWYLSEASIRHGYCCRGQALLLDQVRDFRVGFLAIRGASWCYQRSTQFPWKHSDRMYQVKGFGVFLKNKIGYVEKVVNNLSVLTLVSFLVLLELMTSKRFALQIQMLDRFFACCEGSE